MSSDIEVYTGKDIDLTVTLRNNGQVVTTYTGADTPVSEVWNGDDTAVLFSPITAWIDPTQGTIQVTITAQNTTGLNAGRYYLHTYLQTTDSRSIEAARGSLLLLDSPGTATTPKTYCSYNDLQQYGGCWLENLASNATQGSFLEERGRARSRLDEIIQAHKKNGGFTLKQVILQSSFSCLGTNPILQGYLDNDKLVVTGKVREITAKMALETICRRQISPTGKDNGYRMLAADYSNDVNRLLLSYVAEIDTNDDGFVEWRIPCGSWDIR